MGVAPMHSGFADRCVTTSPLRPFESAGLQSIITTWLPGHVVIAFDCSHTARALRSLPSVLLLFPKLLIAIILKRLQKSF